MSELTDYTEGELIKHICRTGSFTKPSALYLALFSAAPGEAGGGTEITGGAYPRKALNPSDSNWSDQAGGNGQTSNLVQVTFDAPSSNLGQATHLGILDALTGGNLLTYSPLTNARNINNGAPAPYFAVGDLVVTISGCSNYLKGEIIKHIFRTGSFTKPSALAIALYTTNPTDADSGTEVSTGNYGRVSNNPADANWTAPAAGDGHTENVGVLTHPTPNGSWGTIPNWGLRDAPTAGNLLFHGAMLPEAVVVGATDPAPYWPAGGLDITFA
jgi:hypothetical protein